MLVRNGEGRYLADLLVGPSATASTSLCRCVLFRNGGFVWNFAARQGDLSCRVGFSRSPGICRLHAFFSAIQAIWALWLKVLDIPWQRPHPHAASSLGMTAASPVGLAVRRYFILAVFSNQQLAVLVTQIVSALFGFRRTLVPFVVANLCGYIGGAYTNILAHRLLVVNVLRSEESYGSGGTSSTLTRITWFEITLLVPMAIGVVLRPLARHNFPLPAGVSADFGPVLYGAAVTAFVVAEVTFMQFATRALREPFLTFEEYIGSTLLSEPQRDHLRRRSAIVEQDIRVARLCTGSNAAAYVALLGSTIIYAAFDTRPPDGHQLRLKEQFRWITSYPFVWYASSVINDWAIAHLSGLQHFRVLGCVLAASAAESLQ